MHSKDLRAIGETKQRLYMLNAWRDAPVYTERERAAFALVEAVTKAQVPDNIYAASLQQFSEEELIDLTMATIAINSYNRLNATFLPVAGGYQPGMFT